MLHSRRQNLPIRTKSILNPYNSLKGQMHCKASMCAYKTIAVIVFTLGLLLMAKFQ